MTTATAGKELVDSTLSGVYHDPKNAKAAPWCVTEFNGRMSIKHRFASQDEAERFIDQQEG